MSGRSVGFQLRRQRCASWRPRASSVVTEVRREAALLKTGALQSAIFNSGNFSSIATDEKGVIQLFNVGATFEAGVAKDSGCSCALPQCRRTSADPTPRC